MNEPTHIKLDIDLDGWTQRLQANLVQADADGLGWGYRLAGPKYNGSSRNLLSRTLNERDAREIRDALNAVFPDERITQLTDERDRARRWAVGLEQENAELTRRLSEIPRTEQCGHDDYHDPHPWADQRNVSCPGHSYKDDE
ncbi:hypothetical protein [Streptomyces sp. OUCMDZ-3434]|uniref:hypothetical protein n=1 Tax=Streptomyces sp. OUCMDZ-3434 TaxID=1535304 RepID=UPI001E296B7A|nr:hypothetical protein [Streptomyces sp. OUCMDZ-3434]